ncbi:phosphatidylethanolamine N-methyltransferase isoform X2 [Podarcis raffonei]|uniref:phosphatidylethanolamine N-methyltransferase isoform X2 n=1 Tax=Podarcis raffonei TaxID=65483 RepID=UPI0023293E15|nr:phosphatidylethanolamine N-methyltransferase isoform X2 [Podarcis raffonei]
MHLSLCYLDCCEGLSNVDYSQVDLSAMSLLLDFVDVTDPSFGIAVLCIAFNPLFWNLVARWEYRTRSLTRLFRSPYLACYCLGAVIVSLNFLRSHWGLLRHPHGGKGDVFSIQRVGQPHVLGQHHDLPGLVRHACEPSWSHPDGSGGAVLHNCFAVRRAFHRRNISPESSQEQLGHKKPEKNGSVWKLEASLPPPPLANGCRII